MSIFRKINKKIILIYLLLSAYIFYVFYRTNPLNLNSNCGFDGSLYCKIALGELVFEPYSRRTFIPKLISLFPITNESVYQYFYFFNLFVIIGTISFLFWFFLKLKNSNFIYLLILLIFNPNFLRMLESMPVMLDFFALLFVLIYFSIYYTNNQKKFLIILISIVTVLAFTRENLPILITFSIFTHSIVFHFKNFKSTLFNLIILIYTIFITFISFKQSSIDAPNYVPDTEIKNVLIFWLQDIIRSPDDFFRFIYLLFIGLGFIGIMSLISWKQIIGVNGYIYLFSFLSVISGVLLGGDTARIMFIPFVTLTLIYLTNKKMNTRTLLLICLTIISWNPMQFSDGSEFSFLQMYGQRYLDFAVYKQQMQQIVFNSIFFIILFLVGNAIYDYLRTKNGKFSQGGSDILSRSD